MVITTYYMDNIRTLIKINIMNINGDSHNMIVLNKYTIIDHESYSRTSNLLQNSPLCSPLMVPCTIQGDTFF